MLEGIEFTNGLFFWLLLILPFLTMWYVLKHKQQNASLKVSALQAFGKQSQLWSLVKHLLFLLRLTAIGLIIVAMARPQTVDVSSKIKNTLGIDIVMAIDVSASMLAKDLKPSRLEALKTVAGKFIARRPNDRIGLVEYAGESYTRTPITSDKNIVLKSMKEIEYNTIITGGTAIGMGLATSVNRIKDSKSKSKVIILLTDGVNNAGFIDPLTAAELAKEYEIKIYSIGLGTNGLALSPVGINARGKLNYANIQVEIDEELLTQISEMSGGKYFRATNNSKLKEIYDEIDKLEKTEIEEFRYYSVDEKFRVFLIPAIILIVFELLMKFTILKSFI